MSYEGLNPNYLEECRIKKEVEELKKENATLKQKFADAPRIAAEAVVKNYLSFTLQPPIIYDAMIIGVEKTIRDALAGKEEK